MWYVVQVETGRENAACRDIWQAASDVLEECFVPLYRTGRRQPDGRWVPCEERLFPGYLICVTDKPDELAIRLRRVSGLTRILGNDSAFIPLDAGERSWIQRATQKGVRTVGESVGYLEGGTLVVLDGPLAGHEDWIVKVSHRKRLAYLEIPMGGRKVHAQAGLRMVSGHRAALLSGEK